MCGAVGWYANEMLFGFTVAVIAGFLLAAEKNRTDIQSLNGLWLGALVFIWLAGRISSWLPLPVWIIVSIDLLFLPLLAIPLFIPLLITSQYQHLVFIIIVLSLFIANLLFHLNHLFPHWNISNLGIQIAWMSIILLITVMVVVSSPFLLNAVQGYSIKHARIQQ